MDLICVSTFAHLFLINLHRKGEITYCTYNLFYNFIILVTQVKFLYFFYLLQFENILIENIFLADTLINELINCLFILSLGKKITPRRRIYTFISFVFVCDFLQTYNINTHASCKIVTYNMYLFIGYACNVIKIFFKFAYKASNQKFFAYFQRILFLHIQPFLFIIAFFSTLRENQSNLLLAYVTYVTILVNVDALTTIFKQNKYYFNRKMESHLAYLLDK